MLPTLAAGCCETSPRLVSSDWVCCLEEDPDDTGLSLLFT